MYKLRSALVPHVRSDVLALLVEFSSAECTNDRGRIYALNAIADMQVGVSYRKSLQSIYTGYAGLHIKLGNLAILNCADMCRSTGPSVPSWVPDWRLPPRYMPLVTQLVAQTPNDQKLESVAAAQIHNVGEILVLDINGIKLGTVSRVASGAPLTIRAGNLLGTLHDWYSAFDFRVNRFARRLGSEQTLANQFIATITMGTVPKRKDALCRTMMGRTCFWSTDGSFGLGPAEMQPENIVVAIPRRPTPYVLRPNSGKS
jgi:hypothetical protein